MLMSGSIQTGRTAAGAALSVRIFRCAITFRTPRSSMAASPASTGPDRPASAVIDALPRVVAVFSRKREAFGSFGRSRDTMMYGRPKAIAIAFDASSCA
jgi:hypothetical protein